MVFWQTDQHDQPAFISEAYGKAFTSAAISKEQAYYDSDLLFTLKVSDGQQSQPLAFTLKASESFDSVYRNALKALLKEPLGQALAGLTSQAQAVAEKAFFKGLTVADVQYTHRHYVQDNEYIPYGEDIPAFLAREIAKPIIRWQDSPQLGYEILPNKYFYQYQAPKPTAELLAEFWALEQQAVSLLKSLAG